MTPQKTSGEPLETPPVEQRRVAVLIVTRDQHNELNECLRALAGAPLVVVVDNGSNDTLGMEEEYPKARFIRLPRDFGMTKALNIGLRAVDAEMILLLSPGVRIGYATVLDMAETLEGEPNTGAVCPLLVDAEGQPVAQAGELPSPGMPDPPLRAAQAGERAQSATLEAFLFRSFFLRAMRQIDEKYGDYGSAMEMSQQVKRANKTILIHPTATARVTRRPVESTTAAETDRDIGTARFLGKHHGWAAGLLHLLKRTAAAVFGLRVAKAMALITQKKIDGS